ncbi:MAG TPA: hypothetical protein VFP59_18345 [Candidatus Angelobacter sp.]|nr:hypothetical protein [Candidatus Angelobacter sp.]
MIELISADQIRFTALVPVVGTPQSATKIARNAKNCQKIQIEKSKGLPRIDADDRGSEEPKAKSQKPEAKSQKLIANC